MNLKRFRFPFIKHTNNAEAMILRKVALKLQQGYSHPPDKYYRLACDNLKPYTEYLASTIWLPEWNQTAFCIRVMLKAANGQRGALNLIFSEHPHWEKMNLETLKLDAGDFEADGPDILGILNL